MSGWIKSRIVALRARLRSRRSRARTWRLEYGEEIGEPVAIDPAALSRAHRARDFILLEPDEAEPIVDRGWPTVSGDRVVWAVGDHPADWLAVALVLESKAGDRTLLPYIAAALAEEWPELPLADI